jgi:hypothetical protein
MRIPGAIIAAFCAIFLLTLSFATAQESPAPIGPEPAAASAEDQYDRPIRILGLDDRPKLREQIRIMARESRLSIEEEVSFEWDTPFIIVWTDERTYLDKTGFRPENTAAAASPRLGTIWINESAWMKASPSDNQKTLTHELGHLLLGALPGGQDLPLWANEGIVMHLAGQMSWDEHLRLLTAHTFGQLPSLAQLEESFPRESGAQELAYRMSYAAVDVVAQNYGDSPGSVRRLILRLADPEMGPRTAEEFRDDFRRDGWQIATESALGSRFTTGIVVMTSTGAIFLIITIMVIVAYLIRRKRHAERDQKYIEEMEPWEESLTEADVQDIYGDREERWLTDDDER